MDIIDVDNEKKENPIYNVGDIFASRYDYFSLNVKKEDQFLVLSRKYVTKEMLENQTKYQRTNPRWIYLGKKLTDNKEIEYCAANTTPIQIALNYPYFAPILSSINTLKLAYLILTEKSKKVRQEHTKQLVETFKVGKEFLDKYKSNTL